MGNSNCIFCNILKVSPDLILYEDEDIVLFKDKSPVAKIHLLCIPKKHIKNINYLTSEEIPLLLKMKKHALDYILKNNQNITDKDVNFGFHIPPFNVINHIHMHCIVEPYNSCLNSLVNKCIMRSLDKVIDNIENNNLYKKIN